MTDLDELAGRYMTGGGRLIKKPTLEYIACLEAASRERDALRAGLERIINECPATCETSPAHNMADIARQLLTPRSETPDNLMEGEKS